MTGSGAIHLEYGFTNTRGIADAFDDIQTDGNKLQMPSMKEIWDNGDDEFWDSQQATP